MYIHFMRCVEGLDPVNSKESVLVDTPSLGTLEAAGYDLFAPADGFIDPLSRKLIPLGIKTAFTPGWVGLLLDRSGMGNKGITRFAGVIDSDYRGEWKVILYNSNPSIFSFSRGDRIVQVVFVPFGSATWQEVSSLEESARGSGGLGSTGN